MCGCQHNLSKKKCLKTLISDEEPSIMLLQETKCTSITMEKMVIGCWRSCNVIAVDVEGELSGFSIVYNLIEISLSSFFTTLRNISTKFQPIGFDQYGYITNVYKPQIMQDKLTFT
jgi:hypothetical protein